MRLGFRKAIRGSRRGRNPKPKMASTAARAAMTRGSSRPWPPFCPAEERSGRGGNGAGGSGGGRVAPDGAGCLSRAPVERVRELEITLRVRTEDHALA